MSFATPKTLAVDSGFTLAANMEAKEGMGEMRRRPTVGWDHHFFPNIQDDPNVNGTLQSGTV